MNGRTNDERWRKELFGMTYLRWLENDMFYFGAEDKPFRVMFTAALILENHPGNTYGKGAGVAARAWRQQEVSSKAIDAIDQAFIRMADDQQTTAHELQQAGRRFRAARGWA